MRREFYKVIFSTKFNKELPCRIPYDTNFHGIKELLAIATEEIRKRGFFEFAIESISNYKGFLIWKKGW